jgi:hypothetical protein
LRGSNLHFQPGLTQIDRQVKEKEKNESAVVVLWIYATQLEDRKKIVSGYRET